MLGDFLPEPAAEPKHVRAPGPPGWSPGYEWDGTRGSLTTTGLHERPKTWDAFIRDAGLDPDEVCVQEPVQVRGWDAPKAGGDVVRMHYYRLTLFRRNGHANIDELVKLVKSRHGVKTQAAGESAFVIALGDLQLGKMDGDGVEGTVDRYLSGVEKAIARVKDLRRTNPIGHIHLAYLGDCIEGYVSQGGANAWRTTLTLTEQIRLLRRLMLHAVQEIAPLAEKVTLVSIPGNHDESVRFGNATTRYDDSFAVDAALQVGDALAFNPKTYGHVQILPVAKDELTVTCEIAGTTITHAHGHKWSRLKHWAWWQGQTFGDHAPAAASLLLSGHLHHLHIDTSGKKTFMQVPALEQESTWWRHKTGESGNPGIVTFTTRDGAWSDLAVV